MHCAYTACRLGAAVRARTWWSARRSLTASANGPWAGLSESSASRVRMTGAAGLIFALDWVLAGGMRQSTHDAYAERVDSKLAHKSAARDRIWLAPRGSTGQDCPLPDDAVLLRAARVEERRANAGTRIAAVAVIGDGVRPLEITVNPKLTSESGGEESPPRVRLTIVCDWAAVNSPGISGLCGLIRKRLITGERLVLLHGPLDLDEGAAEEVERTLTGLRLPADLTLISADRVAESLLRISLVKALVEEGLPAVAVSGVDLGLFRRDERGELRVDASRLTWLLGSGVVPVIGPDCLCPGQSVGRTTASEMTRTLAACRDLHSLDVITPTDRVLQFDGSEALALQMCDLERLRAPGPDHFPPDPVPKAAIEAALAAIESGVPVVRIGSIGSLARRTATEIPQGGRGAVVR